MSRLPEHLRYTTPRDLRAAAVEAMRMSDRVAQIAGLLPQCEIGEPHPPPEPPPPRPGWHPGKRH